MATGTDPNYANAWLTPVNSSTGGGSNQYMSFPNINPLQASSGQTNWTPYAGSTNLGHGLLTNPTFSPEFTQQFYNMLQGLTPGSITANQNPLIQMLQQLFSQGPSALPGTSALTTQAQGDPNLSAIVASGGDPTNVTPEWQAMVAAQQQNIAQNQANLKEQFAFGGDLQSSPFGTAMANFGEQTTLDQNSLLAQLTQQAQEAAAGRKLSAAQTLSGNELSAGGALNSSALDFTGQAGQLGQYLMSLDQNQINQLLQMITQGAFAQPGVNQTQTASQTFGNIAGGLGALFGGGGYSSGGGYTSVSI